MADLMGSVASPSTAPGATTGATGGDAGGGGAAPPAGGGGSAPSAPAGAGSSSGAGGGAAPAPAGTAAALSASQAAGGGAAAGQAAASQMESIRDVLNRLGQQALTAQFSDDQALIQHLVLQTQQARQAQDLANYGRQVIGHWPAVQQFLQQQAQQQAGSAAPGTAGVSQQDPWYKEFWQPPDWNPAWEKLILRDGQGNMVTAPGAPPDIVQRYTNYQQFRQQQVEKLMQNPFEFFQPAIVKLARQEAEKLSKETLGRHTDTQFANDFIAKNADWLYAADPNTKQPLFDPVSRQPVLSEWGSRFRDHLTLLQQQGMTDVRAMQHWALQATQRDYLMAQHQQGAGQGGAAPAAGAGTTPASPRQQANQQFLQNAPGATHNPNVGPAGVNGTTPANQVGLSLAERLRAKFAASGIKDSDLI